MRRFANPVPLTQALIRCPSMTPHDAGALDLLQKALKVLGFTCTKLTFDDPGSPPVDNLYARLGRASPHLAFAGHVDVVPPGDVAAWRVDPFSGALIDGAIYGRGAVDMKGAIACFIAAVARFLERGPPAGSISFLLTSDEEGPAINGTRKLVERLSKQGEVPDACLVGEPTNPSEIGEMIKIGRRGSLTGQLRVKGRQGHAAYPERADNPIPRLLAMLRALEQMPLDGGSEHFDPSQLVITSVDVGNPTPNLIPAEARASFSVRFSDQHTARSLEALLREQLDAVGGPYELDVSTAGEAFITLPGPFTDLLESLIERELSIVPELSTSGGTSDARFIKDICQVVEFGLVGATMHQVDERVPVADLEALTKVYHALLENSVRTPDA